MRMDAALFGDRSGTGCPPALLNSHNSFHLEGLYILTHTYMIACTKCSHGNIRAIVPLGNNRHPARQHSPKRIVERHPVAPPCELAPPTGYNPTWRACANRSRPPLLRSPSSAS